MPTVAVIAIGRNEGERLVRCLASARAQADVVVYVDSASSDDSVEAAETLRAEVVFLDAKRPFTAARARNAGVQRIHEMRREVDFYQFVDGDCEIAEGWIDAALAAFDEHPKAAVVCGRRRERFPDATRYNKLCDMEWDTPVGQARACGGDALFRADAFEAADGYDESVIAGEEPELCVRLRRRGGEVWRIDAEMTRHDADMTRFGQWWTRNIRAGHAYAEGCAMHGAPPERHFAKEVRSNRFWAGLLPLGVVAAGVLLGVCAGSAWIPLALVPLGLYGVLFWRVRRHRLSRGDSAAEAGLYARFTTLGKFPQFFGQVKYRKNRLLGRRTKLIEYKGVSDPRPSTEQAGV